MVGRKRHIAVDIDGRLLAVKVTSANVQDLGVSRSEIARDGGILLVRRLVRPCPWIGTVVVDGGYRTRFIEAVGAMANRVVEVVLRPEFAEGFVPLPKRWRVEQSIGALTIHRRLKVDYETLFLFTSLT